MYAMDMADSNHLPNDIILKALTIALPEGLENCAQRRLLFLAKPFFLGQHTQLSRHDVNFGLFSGL